MKLLRDSSLNSLSVFLVATSLSGMMAIAEESDDPPWSFLPLREVSLPTVEDSTWPKNRIDHFILAELEKEGLSPAPVADSRTLQRRLSFDLIGLPPISTNPDATINAQVESWNDTEWSGLVDELLASPQYGERWGRHWLDLARYADVTESWNKTKSPSWLYRDWVVDAFNRDLPYDQFVKLQLANDLLPESRREDNAALGFIGLSPNYWKELQLPPELIGVTVAEEWEERMDTVGRTFLGLTLGCARCHDHKTDPVSAEDYYALAGVFASIQVADQPVIPETLWEPVRLARERVDTLENRRLNLRRKKPAPGDLKEQLAAIDQEIRTIQSSTPHYFDATAAGMIEAALFVKSKQDGQHGTLLEYVPGMAQDLPIHQRGDPNSPGPVVPRRFLSAFPASDGSLRPLKTGSGRLDLAQAIVEEAAPLTARVIVNRVWLHHFGRGLVGTPSEFGPAGDSPSHPDLLEDLSYRFVANGWSLKWLHREILNSATWRQSSQIDPETAERDPENRWYSHMIRRRLDAESWRDAMLSVSGELDLSSGGEPFALDDPAQTRRTLYGRVKRRELDDMLRINDFPDPITHSPSRTETATPLQQLFAMNGPFVIARSVALASLIEGQVNKESERITALYARLFQRAPSTTENALALAYLKDGGTWEEYTQAVLTGNEFLYLD